MEKADKLRLEKVAQVVDRRYPDPARKPGKVVLVKVYSDRMLTDEEVDKRAAKIPRKPGEHRILLNIVKVRSLERRTSAEDDRCGRPGPAPEAAEERELERQVRELEAKKARLLEERARERGKKPLEEGELERRRLSELRKAARKKARTL